MPITEKTEGDQAEMRLEGRLTFADTSDYRRRLNALLAQRPKTLSVLLAGLTFMDSAGLGMLIVTLEECRKNGVTLTLRHPQGDVRELLRVTRCYERFSIVD